MKRSPEAVELAARVDAESVACLSDEPESRPYQERTGQESVTQKAKRIPLTPEERERLLYERCYF